MTNFELFAGCGGLAKGMESAGFVHCGFLEINPWACRTLRKNFNPSLVFEEDARKFDYKRIGKVDVISGGPPCQPFSLGGKARAYKDERDMFPQAVRAISELAPKAFLFENVKGLLRGSFAEYFDYIIQRLTFPTYAMEEGESWREHRTRLHALLFQKFNGLKYRVAYRLLNAADFGVPQIRERVFIVGIRSDIDATWNWPPATTPKEHWRSLGDALLGIPDPRESHGIPDHQFLDGAKVYPGHTGSSLKSPSKTIKAGAHGVPGGENMIRFSDGNVRYLSVYEAKIVQSFPRDYVIEGGWGEAMRQIGNAVPVKLAETVGRHLKEVLESADSKPFARPNRKTTSPYRTDSDGLPVLFEQNGVFYDAEANEGR